MSDGVTVLERATEMANEMSLFSDNEDVEEVATSSLKWVAIRTTASHTISPLLLPGIYYCQLY